MSRLTLGFGLLVAWVLLWGSASPGTILGGVVVISAMYAIFPSTRRPFPQVNFHPLAATRLVLYFVGQLVVSNLLLSIELLRRRPTIRPVVVDVPMVTASPTIVTAVCNLCAMSPGTMVVGVNLAPPIIRVHILVFGHRETHDEAVEGIRRLERYAIAAFGSPDDRARAAELAGSGAGPVEVVQ